MEQFINSPDLQQEDQQEQERHYESESQKEKNKTDPSYKSRTDEGCLGGVLTILLHHQDPLELIRDYDISRMNS